MALLLLALLPLALPWGLVCFGSLAVMLFTLAFPCVGLPRIGGLLVALPEVRLSGMLLVSFQGASDSMPHSSPEGEVVASGFWHSGTGVAPGNVPSSWHGCLPGAGSVFVRLYLLRMVLYP